MKVAETVLNRVVGEEAVTIGKVFVTNCHDCRCICFPESGSLHFNNNHNRNGLPRSQIITDGMFDDLSYCYIKYHNNYIVRRLLQMRLISYNHFV